MAAAVGAVESGGAHGLICEKWQDGDVSPFPPVGLECTRVAFLLRCV